MRRCTLVVALLCWFGMTVAAQWPSNRIALAWGDHRQFDFQRFRPPSPVFWTASVKVQRGYALSYEHLIVHTTRRLGLSLALTAAHWHALPHNVSVLSAHINARFWWLRHPTVDTYLLYSVAGPSWMSQQWVNHRFMGGAFIFQDMLGLGARFGRQKQFDLALKWVHYSNGDVFPVNPGFDSPLMVEFGVVY